MTDKIVHGYKGFDKEMACRGFQYEEGGEYETEEAVLCERGFHFCENPLDVFGYYDPANSMFTEVEGSGKTVNHNEDSKIACTKIKIGAEISLTSMIHAGVKFVFDRVDWKNQKESNTGHRSAATNTGDCSAATNTGDYSAATNTGYRSAATNIGDYSAATNTGDRSAATNTGNRSAATNTGHRSAATNTGDYSAATNTGYRSAATNIGDYSAATNTGHRSAATNTGYRSAATVEGKDSIACGLGYGCVAKGAEGCWLVLAERNDDYEILWVKSAKVDGEKIKANVFYKLKNGKFCEVKCNEPAR